jgi:hypothetical protein
MDTPGGGNLLGQKVGPLPLVAWVGLAGGAVAIWLAVRSRSNSGSSGPAGAGISMLDPSSAEAFGTLEQQQIDLTNTLSQMAQSNQANFEGLNFNTQTGMWTYAQQIASLINGVGTQVQGVDADVHAVGSQEQANAVALNNNTQNAINSLATPSKA